jgi:hypothetical protein
MLAGMGSKPLPIKGVLGDTKRLYRSLFRRSFLTGFVVFALVGLLDAAVPHVQGWALTAVGAAATIAAFVGTTFVQGALVPAVDSEHRGAPVPGVTELYRSSWARLGSLVALSILTGVAVGLGFLLFVVPGVLLAIRWALAAPVVMLEGLGARAAMKRSRELVRGHRGAVFLVLLNVWARIGLAWLVLTALLHRLATVTGSDLLVYWLAAALASALVTPYAGHALSVVYYRLTDPDKPVIAEDRRTWHSVWREHDAAEL